MHKKNILVIGLGAFGSTVVETLWASPDLEVTAVDLAEDAVDAIKDRAAYAYVGDASQLKVLEGVGAQDADCAIISFAEDLEASVLCVATLKRLGVREIIARAASERQAEVLRAVGATRVLELEREMGRVIAVELSTSASSDLLDFAHGYRVVPWVANGPLLGQSLAAAALRKRYDVTVLGYSREASVVGKKIPRNMLPATPEYVIQQGDVLMLVGTDAAVTRFLGAQ